MFGLIVSGLNGVLSVVAKLVPAIIKIVGVALEKLSAEFENFFKELGLLESNETVEEIGDKALQAEQDELEPIKIENFDSHEKYLAAVKEYEIDAEKSALIPQDDKLHKAIEVLTGTAIEQYGQPMGDFAQIVVNNPEFYSKVGRLVEFANLARTDPQTFAAIINYMENKNLSTEENDAAFDKLVELEKKHSPEATDAEVWTAVGEMTK